MGSRCLQSGSQRITFSEGTCSLGRLLVYVTAMMDPASAF